MSQDSFTEVTSQSWFGRLGGAIKGVVVGLILFVVAFPLLFWNEGRAVLRYKTLKEGGGAVVSVASERVDAANNGKLVHVTGRAETAETLADPVFGISAPVLKLTRSVEMYQWEERTQSKTKEKVGGGSETVTTYTYQKTWSDRPISSGSFKHPEGHQNPGSFPFESSHLTAGKITLGAFTLSRSLVGMIGNFEPFPVGGGTPVPKDVPDAKLYGAGFFLGANPSAPEIGNVRVTFKVAKPSEISVIAKQAGDSFEPYVAKTGGSLELLQEGIVSADAMIKKAQDSNRILTWVLRLAGFLLMLIGLNVMLKPLSVFASVLPFMGSIVGAGTGFVSFLLALGFSFATISIAWFVYRPVVGGLLLAGAIAMAFAIKHRAGKNRNQPA